MSRKSERQDPTPIDAAPVELVSGFGDAISSAEVDLQVRTAKLHPRSLERFERQVLTYATHSQEIAASCFYSLPRGGKNIEGMSVRLAEIVAMSWQNLRVGSRVVDEGVDQHNPREGFVRVEGAAIDLENNLAFRSEVRRRVYRDGKGRLDSEVAGMAAQSIALRNAIFRVVPAAVLAPIEQKIKSVAVGRGKPIQEVRDKCLTFLRGMGVADEAICAAVNRPSVKDIDHDDVFSLRRRAQALHEGGDRATIFPDPAAGKGAPKPKSRAQQAVDESKKGDDDLAAVLAARREEAGPAVWSKVWEDLEVAVPMSAEEIQQAPERIQKAALKALNEDAK